jgi:hypothetical protein
VNSVTDTIRWNIFIFVPYARETVLDRCAYQLVQSKCKISKILYQEDSQRFVSSVQNYLVCKGTITLNSIL